jgi:hypothetical protein
MIAYPKNLLETGPGGFRQVSEFFIIITYLKKKIVNKKSGNLLETAAAGFRRFPDNP